MVRWAGYGTPLESVDGVCRALQDVEAVLPLVRYPLMSDEELQVGAVVGGAGQHCAPTGVAQSEEGCRPQAVFLSVVQCVRWGSGFFAPTCSLLMPSAGSPKGQTECCNKDCKKSKTPTGSNRPWCKAVPAVLCCAGGAAPSAVLSHPSASRAGERGGGGPGPGGG